VALCAIVTGGHGREVIGRVAVAESTVDLASVRGVSVTNGHAWYCMGLPCIVHVLRPGLILPGAVDVIGDYILGRDVLRFVALVTFGGSAPKKSHIQPVGMAHGTVCNSVAEGL
jgi:hypothetical protein